MKTGTCEQCGKVFEYYGTKQQKFCSTTCYGISQRKPVAAKTCVQCGEPLKGIQLLRQRQYCSRTCYEAASAAVYVTKQCPVCRKDFTVLVSVSDRYTVCSMACRLAETKYVACERCGKTFVAERLLNRHYCSEECRRPPKYITCKTCGKRVRTVPGDVDRQFCSFACYRRSQGETNLEARVRQALTVVGVEFVQEYRVGRYSIDFAIPAKMIAIEVDGTYWHPPGRDAAKDKRLRNLGWTIVRVAEIEVEHAPDTVALVVEKLNTVAHLKLTCLQPSLFDL